jgi:LytTr DNA-binding domain
MPSFLHQVRSTPYPWPSWSLYLRVLASIGASVAFILVVFQPFGSGSMAHPYKYAILAGYGGVIVLAGVLVYAVWQGLVSAEKLDRWSFFDELVFLFANTLLCQLACYGYWALVFGHTPSMAGLWGFLQVALLVSCLPIAAYLVFVFGNYRGIRFASEAPGSIAPVPAEKAPSQVELQPPLSLRLHGQGKQAKLKARAEDLLFLRAEDNYVVVHLLEDGREQRRMLRCTLAEAEAQLGDTVLRCHRSYLVNRQKIAAVSGNKANARLLLIGSAAELPISRQLIDPIREMLVYY